MRSSDWSSGVCSSDLESLRVTRCRPYFLERRNRQCNIGALLCLLDGLGAFLHALLDANAFAFDDGDRFNGKFVQSNLNAIAILTRQTDCCDAVAVFSQNGGIAHRAFGTNQCLVEACWRYSEQQTQ